MRKRRTSNTAAPGSITRHPAKDAQRVKSIDALDLRPAPSASERIRSGV